MSNHSKVAEISNECVACGSCEKACPFHAVTIFKGFIAHVDETRCVGCGKCREACPASVITIRQRRR